MLFAHVVPAYFAATVSQRRWPAEWTRAQRLVIWGAAFGSVAAPDVDIVTNVLAGRYINHSYNLLWTHSLFTHLGVALLWFVLWRLGRRPYLRTLIGLVAIGGLSHLLLDAIAHGTPLFNPFTLALVGFPPARIVAGGFWAYVTDPLFLLEPYLLALAGVHWLAHNCPAPRLRRLALLAVAGVLESWTIAFVWMLPGLQQMLR